jgi:hypothetical protein
VVAGEVWGDGKFERFFFGYALGHVMMDWS